MRTVLFICSGNTCRSPMAEGIFNAFALRRGVTARAFSRGIAAVTAPAAENAVTAAGEYGADISGHIARQVMPEDIAAADHVYCMTEAHASALRRAWPQFAGKISLMDDKGIPDPYGGNTEQYRAAAAQIAAAAERILGAEV